MVSCDVGVLNETTRPILVERMLFCSEKELNDKAHLLEDAKSKKESQTMCEYLKLYDGFCVNVKTTSTKNWLMKFVGGKLSKFSTADARKVDKDKHILKAEDRKAVSNG